MADDVEVVLALGPRARGELPRFRPRTEPAFVFTSDRDRPGRDRLGPGFEVYTMAVDGSDIVRLTNNRRPDIFPDWQRLPALP